MSTHMGSINISIKKEAYDYLKSLKQKEQSFSDVIIEFKQRKGSTGKDLLEYAGALKDLDIDWKEKEKRMKEFRESFDKRIKETTKYMEKMRKNDRN